MKNTLKSIIVAGALFATAITSVAAGFFGGVPNQIVTSSSGSFVASSLATNGIYPASIQANTTLTNLLLLNPGGQPDGDIVIQLTATQTGTTATNVVFVLSSSVNPATITNNTTLGINMASQPRAIFQTVTLALSTTAGTYVTTNIVYSRSSTPPLVNGLNLYLESIAMGYSTGALTNYSVSEIQ